MTTTTFHHETPSDDPDPDRTSFDLEVSDGDVIAEVADPNRTLFHHLGREGAETLRDWLIANIKPATTSDDQATVPNLGAVKDHLAERRGNGPPLAEVDRKLRDHGMTEGSVLDRVAALCAKQAVHERSKADMRRLWQPYKSDLHEEIKDIDLGGGPLLERVRRLAERVRGGEKAEPRHHASRDKAELGGVYEVLDRAAIKAEGSAEDRVAALVRERDAYREIADEVDCIFAEGHFTKGTLVSRAHEVVGKLNARGPTGLASKAGFDSMLGMLREAEDLLDGSGLDLKRSDHTSLGMLPDLVRKCKTYRGALDSIDRVFKGGGFTKGSVVKRAREVMVDLKCVEKDRDEVLESRRRFVRERDTARALAERVGMANVDLEKNLDQATDWLREIHELLAGEAYPSSPADFSTIPSAMVEALAHAQVGRAMCDLEAQLMRLRDNHDDSMAFGLWPEAIAEAVRAEVDEVVREEPNSGEAREETAGVLATAIHLVRVHGWNLYDAMRHEERKIRERLDWVEHGGKTWAEAKRLVARGEIVHLTGDATIHDLASSRFKRFQDVTPPTHGRKSRLAVTDFKGEFGDGEAVTVNVNGPGEYEAERLEAEGKTVRRVTVKVGDDMPKTMVDAMAPDPIAARLEAIERRLDNIDGAKAEDRIADVATAPLQNMAPFDRKPAPDGWAWMVGEGDVPDPHICGLVRVAGLSPEPFIAYNMSIIGPRIVTRGVIPNHVLEAVRAEFIRLGEGKAPF